MLLMRANSEARSAASQVVLNVPPAASPANKLRIAAGNGGLGSALQGQRIAWSWVKPRKSVEQRFHELAEQWRRETGGYSSISQITEHPAYQEIIAMGDVAIPWILHDLQQRPGHWFVALRKITGQSPILEGDRGNMSRMRAAWLAWGKEAGYID